MQRYPGQILYVTWVSILSHFQGPGQINRSNAIIAIILDWLIQDRIIFELFIKNQFINLIFCFPSFRYNLEPGNGNSMHCRYSHTLTKTNGSFPIQPSWQLATSATTISKSKL